MITETVLEMHFHRPLMELFRGFFGVGTGRITFYKYSPQKECFIGFDQAYARTDLSEGEFFEMLRQAAASTDSALDDKFMGYFLQFKVVSEMHKRVKRYTPPSISNRPYYRVGLYTTKSVGTGLSQHEMLWNLNQNRGAMVYYACPMIFDRAALYDVEVDLDQLSLADVASCPSPYTDNDNHFIFYNDTQAVPIWCSEPVEGNAIRPAEFAEAVQTRVARLNPAASARELLDLLTHIESAGVSPESEFVRSASSPNIAPLVAESLTILRVGTFERSGEAT